MKRRVGRMLVILLVLATMLSVLPMTALAADDVKMVGSVSQKDDKANKWLEGSTLFPEVGTSMISFNAPHHRTTEAEVTMKQKGGSASYKMPDADLSVFYSETLDNSSMLFLGKLPTTLPAGDYYFECTYRYIVSWTERTWTVGGLTRTTRTPNYSSYLTVKSSDTVTVKKGAWQPPPPVTSMQLSEFLLFQNLGLTNTITVTQLPASAGTRTVTWSSGNEKVATVSGGVVKAIGYGKTWITATIAKSDNQPEVKAYTYIIVSPTVVDVTGISVSPTSLTVDAGKTATIKPTLKPANATNDLVLWKSSNPAIAKVDAYSGVVTGVKAGTATITAKAACGNKYSATCSVTVKGSAGGGTTVTGGKWENWSGVYYYKLNGAYLKNWQLIDGAWYYLGTSGAMVTGWKAIDGKWYFFNSSGSMFTGWKNDGAWYYLKPGSGDMAVGWCKDGNTWYYFTPGGVMKTGWVSDGGKWYFMEGSGAMKTGWVSSGGAWYFMDGNGAMKTGWVTSGGKWYFMQGNGAMKTGWQLDGGKWYYLKPGSGEMATGTLLINGVTSKFDNNGVWIG